MRELPIAAQPDDVTCGPTALQAVYRYHGAEVDLGEVLRSVRSLEEGGTLGVLLAIDALRRGHPVTLHTMNLRVFDPTWFVKGALRPEAVERLRRRRELQGDPKLRVAIEAYLEFIELGGELRFDELHSRLIRRHVERGEPVLVGLSATYLYQSPREIGTFRTEYDDVRGDPTGHFVVVVDYDPDRHEFRVADPLRPNPLAGPGQHYDVRARRLLGAIYLGVLTYDGNLIVVGAKGAQEPAR